MRLSTCFKKKIHKRGNILMFVMVFGSVSFVMIVGGLMGYAALEHRGSVRMHQSDMAFGIAEKGIEYARWRLAQDAKDFIFAPGFHTSLKLSITFDSFPNETTWSIRNSDNQIMYSGGGPGHSPHSSVIHEYPLEPGEYTFTIYDSYGDGICCGVYGNGSYTLTSGNNELVFHGDGQFGSSEITLFTIVSSQPDPYQNMVHDRFGELLGEYTLHVNVLEESGGMVEVTSEGRLHGQNKTVQVIRAIFDKASSLEHVIMADKNIYLDAHMNITGSVMSNGGVRADTMTGSWIQSAQSTFSYDNGNITENGVFGTGGGESFWQFPVSAFHMNDFTDMWSELYEIAKNDGTLYRAYNYRNSPSFPWWIGAPNPCTSVDFLQQGGNGQCGMGIRFFPNGTYRVYKLFRSQFQSPQATQVEIQPFPNSLFWSGNSDDIPANFFPRNYDAPLSNNDFFNSSEALPIGSAKNIPENGVIFFENTHVWVGGETPSRVTVVAARTNNPYHDATSPRSFPLTYNDMNASIFFAGNIIQSNLGTAGNAVGLIAQNFIAPTWSSYSDLTIHAALFSRFASIGLPKHSEFNKSSFNFSGAMIAGGRGTSLRYADGTGYQSVTIDYDASLKYSPPPGFPVSSYYELVSWERLTPGGALSSSSLLADGESCTEGSQCASGYCNENNQCQVFCSEVNLITNGDFATNSGYMWWWNSTNASVSFHNGFANFTINSDGGQPWQPELGQQVSLTENQLYTLQFDVKTDQSPRSIIVEMHGGADSNYVNRGLLETVDVTTVWNTRTLTFISNATDATSDITFKFGGNINNVQIDNVKLFAGEPCE